MKPINCILAFTLFAPQAVVAQAGAPQVNSTGTAVVNEDVGVPVFPYDITDRPYRVLGEIKAGVRKATAFSKSPSQKKIYGELWERARKLGADAVVNAKYGDAHVTAMSWGKANATGTAIKFLNAGDVGATVPASAKN